MKSCLSAKIIISVNICFGEFMNRHLSHDLRQYADQLEKSSFKPLTAGIGLGVRKPTSRLGRYPALETGRSLHQDEVMADKTQQLPDPAGQNELTHRLHHRSNDRTAEKSKRFFLSFFTRGLDTVIVLISTITITCFYFELNGSPDLPFARRLIWLMGKSVSFANPVEMLIGYCFAFASYLLLFKMVVGETLGDLCLQAMFSRETRNNTAEL